MKQLGMYLVIFGVGSMVLNYFNYEFRILMWIDNWGSTVGWGIRSALFVVGTVMFFLGGPAAKEASS